MSVPNIISSKEPVQEFSTTVAKKGKSKGANTSEKVAKNLVDELTRARDQLLQVHLKAARIGSIPILNSISSLLSTITVYLSAVTQEHPLFASYPLGKFPRYPS